MRENYLKLFDGMKIHSAMTAITAMKMFTQWVFGQPGTVYYATLCEGTEAAIKAGF